MRRAARRVAGELAQRLDPRQRDLRRRLGATLSTFVALMVLLLSLVSAGLGGAGRVEHLLVCMAAGFVVRNVFPRASANFLDALEQSSAPIYVLFFALVILVVDFITKRIVLANADTRKT